MPVEKKLKAVGKREEIRVLTILDDEQVQGFIRRALELEGMKTSQLLFAEDTDGALKQIEELPKAPDLIFLNLRLANALSYPFINDFNDRRQTDPRFRNSHLVVISATDDPEVIQTCQNLGADGFIPVPLEIDQLIDTVSNFLTEKERRIT